MARRPASARGRFYCASVDAGMCEAAFNAAVIEVVATFDLQLDGDLAGEYRSPRERRSGCVSGRMVRRFFVLGVDRRFARSQVGRASGR